MTWVFIMQIVVIAWTYTVVLTVPGMLLSPVFACVTEWVNHRSCNDNWNWREYIMKPVILCPVCVAGQMALWCWIFPEQAEPVLSFLFVPCATMTITYYGTKLTERL